MKEAFKTPIELVFLLAMLSSCATFYHPLNPDKISGHQQSTGLLEVSYRPENLKGQYAKRQYRSLCSMIAVRITNKSSRAIIPANDLKIFKGDAEVSIMSTDEYYYLQVRNKFFTSAEMGALPLEIQNNATQEISKDENANYQLVVRDKEGNTLMTGRSDENGSLSVTSTVTLYAVPDNYVYTLRMADYCFGGPCDGQFIGIKSFSVNSEYTVKVYKSGTLVYQGIGDGYSYTKEELEIGTPFKIESANPFTITHDYGCEECPAWIPEHEGSAIHYFRLLQPGTMNISGNFALYNMENRAEVANIGTHNPGHYKLIALEGTVTLSYITKYNDVSYNYYNQEGQLVASIAPEGVKRLYGAGINNYTSKESIPFINLYEYDIQGRLVSSKTPDAGKTEYVYRKDGKIRFSQNALQKQQSKYSYTNYDAYGRTVESGEYSPGSGGIAFNADLSQNSPMKGILENITAHGGLITGTKYDVIRTKYDVPDATHGQYGYQQDDWFLRGAVSVTERYNTIVNTTPNEVNLASRTWYNYDENGQVIWTISFGNGLGYKTIDYTYDELGNVTKVIYQKNRPTDRFVHYFEYDDDNRLKSVYTNTTDNATTKSLQVQYYHYLHGPLKRVELAGSLQGIDYVYTANGKLKAVNHANRSQDPGKDGIANSFAPDVFGMNIEYHSGDYSRTGTNIASIQPSGYTQYYNGNINAISWHTRKPAGTGGTLESPVMNAYRYDGKYQFQSSSWGVPDFTSNTFAEQANVNKEHSLVYDLNGNINILKRTNSSGSLIGNYTYSYATNTNKLASVGNYASYQYNAIGQMTREQRVSGRTFYLQYDAAGMVSKIYGDAAHTQLKFSFTYNEQGLRIKKQDHTNNMITGYVYDVVGNVMAVYDNHTGGTWQLKEQPVYGAGRLGIYFEQDNNYQYELTDHLGNFRAVINRTKLSNGLADVVYYADYYPNGKLLRAGGAGDWRYGYQGAFAEEDGETEWNHFKLREYDPSIARWFTTDPYGQYASPYLGMGNNPLVGVDPDGGFFWKWMANLHRKRFGGADASELYQSRNEWVYNKITEGGFTTVVNSGASWLGPHSAGDYFWMANPDVITYSGHNRYTWSQDEINTMLNIYWTVTPLPVGWAAKGVFRFGGWAFRAAKGTSEGAYVVYQGFDKAGIVRYIGITKRLPVLRFTEHLNSKTTKSLLQYRVVDGAVGLSRTGARVWEQTLINEYRLQKNGGLLFNKINLIAPKYWWEYGIK